MAYSLIWYRVESVSLGVQSVQGQYSQVIKSSQVYSLWPKVGYSFCSGLVCQNFPACV